MKIVIIHKVHIAVIESESVICPKITLVIKEFSVVFPVTTVVVPVVAAITAARPFSSLALLSTPPFSPPFVASYPLSDPLPLLFYSFSWVTSYVNTLKIVISNCLPLNLLMIHLSIGQ